MDPKAGDTHSPQSLDRYVYCFNNPLRFTDPTGERGGGKVGHAKKHGGPPTICLSPAPKATVILVRDGDGHAYKPSSPYDEVPIWIDSGAELLLHGSVIGVGTILGYTGGGFGEGFEYMIGWAVSGEGSIGGLAQHYEAGCDYGAYMGYYLSSGDWDSFRDLDIKEYLDRYEYLKENYDKTLDKQFDSNWDLKTWWPSPIPIVPLMSIIDWF